MRLLKFIKIGVAILWTCDFVNIIGKNVVTRTDCAVFIPFKLLESPCRHDAKSAIYISARLHQACRRYNIVIVMRYIRVFAASRRHDGTTAKTVPRCHDVPPLSSHANTFGERLPEFVSLQNI